LERELFAWVRAKKADLLKAIGDKKDISKDGIEDKIKAALEQFTATFA
jgi:F0F1-type ATP synthase alpha subunit